MTPHKPIDRSLASHAAQPITTRVSRHGATPRGRQLATGPQLWRLNQQGVLRLEFDAATFLLGGPLAEWPGVTQDEATSTLDRLLAERWPGLGRWPKAGESWVVQGGLVLPAAPVEDAS